MGEVMAVAVLPVKRCCPTMTSPFSSRTHRWAQESATGMTTPRACTMPENTRTIDNVGQVKIDQVVIGSCTNGRLSDLRIAANLLKGKKIAKNVRCIVFPGTQTIYLDAMREGLVEAFIQAGAVVSTPTCGPCLGGHMGILAAGERAVSTTNRNFVGRMGHVDSEVYLASPAVAAASAITGYITDPAKV